jgi:hypothetical protein
MKLSSVREHYRHQVCWRFFSTRAEGESLERHQMFAVVGKKFRLVQIIIPSPMRITSTER